MCCQMILSFFIIILFFETDRRNYQHLLKGNFCKLSRKFFEYPAGKNVFINGSDLPIDM